MATTSPAPSKPAETTGAETVDAVTGALQSAKPPKSSSKPKSAASKSKPASSSKSKPASTPQPSDAERLRVVLKRAQMSEGSELTDEQRQRALSAPDSMKGARLRDHIRGRAGNGNGGETRERSPEHADLAKLATQLVRSNSPTRAAISTRAVAATVQHVGRKDWHKLLGGITAKQAKQFAAGAIRFSELADDCKQPTRDVVAKIGAAAQLKRFEARELLAILVARDSAK